MLNVDTRYDLLGADLSDMNINIYKIVLRNNGLFYLLPCMRKLSILSLKGCRLSSSETLHTLSTSDIHADKIMKTGLTIKQRAFSMYVGMYVCTCSKTTYFIM